jgi:hypothetical protein
MQKQFAGVLEYWSIGVLASPYSYLASFSFHHSINPNLECYDLHAFGLKRRRTGIISSRPASIPRI